MERSGSFISGFDFGLLYLPSPLLLMRRRRTADGRTRMMFSAKEFKRREGSDKLQRAPSGGERGYYCLSKRGQQSQ